MVCKSDRLCLLKMCESRHISFDILFHQFQKNFKNLFQESVKLNNLISCIKSHIQCNLVVSASSCMQLLSCIPDPVDQVRLNKAVNIFIFICNLKCSVFHILTDPVQSVNDLLLLILSQNPLFCKHCHMRNTSADILLIESLVERDGCVKIINQLICLFCKTTAP